MSSNQYAPRHNALINKNIAITELATQLLRSLNTANNNIKSTIAHREKANNILSSHVKMPFSRTSARFEKRVTKSSEKNTKSTIASNVHSRTNPTKYTKTHKPKKQLSKLEEMILNQQKENAKKFHQKQKLLHLHTEFGKNKTQSNLLKPTICSINHHENLTSKKHTKKQTHLLSKSLPLPITKNKQKCGNKRQQKRLKITKPYSPKFHTDRLKERRLNKKKEDIKMNVKKPTVSKSFVNRRPKITREHQKRRPTVPKSPKLHTTVRQKQRMNGFTVERKSLVGRIRNNNVKSKNIKNNRKSIINYNNKNKNNNELKDKKTFLRKNIHNIKKSKIMKGVNKKNKTKITINNHKNISETKNKEKLTKPFVKKELYSPVSIICEENAELIMPPFTGLYVDTTEISTQCMAPSPSPLIPLPIINKNCDETNSIINYIKTLTKSKHTKTNEFQFGFALDSFDKEIKNEELLFDQISTTILDNNSNSPSHTPSINFDNHTKQQLDELANKMDELDDFLNQIKNT